MCACIPKQCIVEFCLLLSFIKMKSRSIFQLRIMFLTFTQVDISLYFIYFLWCIVFHCLNILQFLSFCHPWVFALFPVFLSLQTRLLWTFWNESPDAPAQEILEVELLDYGVCVCSIYKTVSNCFPKWLCLCLFPAAVYKSFRCFISRLKFARLLHFCQTCLYKMVILYSLNLHFSDC